MIALVEVIKDLGISRDKLIYWNKINKISFIRDNNHIYISNEDFQIIKNIEINKNIKICSKCSKKGNKELFRGKICKECVSKDYIKKYNKNKEFANNKRSKHIEWSDNNKEYIKKYDKDYRIKNKDKLTAREKSRWKNNREYESSRWKCWRYKITKEELKSLEDNANGKCGICQRNKNLHIDHDHITGKVRGLLCQGCNTAIGKFQDNITIMQNAINYINKNSQQPLNSLLTNGVYYE